MKKIYAVRAFREWHEVETFEEGQQIFDNLVASNQFNYVEFSEVETTPKGGWYSKSIKIFCR